MYRSIRKREGLLRAFPLLFVNAIFYKSTMEMITVRIPHTPMARPLMAPSVSPSSMAFEVPTAWLQAPMARPAVIGFFTPEKLDQIRGQDAAQDAGEDHRDDGHRHDAAVGLATSTAMGVVMDFGSREAVMASSRPNSLQST